MNHTYMFTGFPGFIASAIAEELITSRDDIKKLYFLVLPKEIEKAEEKLSQLRNKVGKRKIDLELVLGDITKSDLGIDPEIANRLKGEIDYYFHLAAIYDLAVPKKIAYQVNVVGTRHVGDWLKECLKLQRYIYFSTAYVSGSREGVILETELACGQTFKNHYEETKYQAEVIVENDKQTLPTTIIRPGVVRGHSKTGETTKFDGPYFVLNLFNRLGKIGALPYIGSGGADGNFVPIDYVIQATSYLAHATKAEGKTYHITDPNPYSMKQVYEVLHQEMIGRKPIGSVPLSLSKFLLTPKWMQRWVGVEREALDYFTCMSRYDCSNTLTDLKGSGITCPRFEETAGTMVRYYKDHCKVKEKYIKI
ncbi:SDR family oxidoreductase [Bacillus sp. FJAT-45037]|uniref:SDR family oxidoreductase n=1 Tax=Bacillus sp. FJAT-45037 TaxID=2011007 RepID=UPI000C230F1A|nr:SDR family oxidoreductase [Bacillus sp. FJAT-45037]